MHKRALFAFLLAIALAGCSSTGPGAECDPCAQAEARAGSEATGPFAQAAAASAKGGQEASNQPVMTDPGARGVYTPISRGAGSQTMTVTTSDPRSQAGAPSVNQALVTPTEASARTGGGVSPVVASLQSYVDDLRANLKLALLDPTTPPNRVTELMAAIDAAIGQMAQAQAAAQAQTVNNYHFDGARIVQTVANGSNSGDGQTAINPDAAEALGKPLSEAAKAAMEAGEGFPAPGPAPGGSSAPAPSGGSPGPAPGDGN